MDKDVVVPDLFAGQEPPVPEPSEERPNECAACDGYVHDWISCAEFRIWIAKRRAEFKAVMEDF